MGGGDIGDRNGNEMLVQNNDGGPWNYAGVLSSLDDQVNYPPTILQLPPEVLYQQPHDNVSSSSAHPFFRIPDPVERSSDGLMGSSEEEGLDRLGLGSKLESSFELALRWVEQEDKNSSR